MRALAYLRHFPFLRSGFLARETAPHKPDTKSAFYPVWAVLADRVRRSGAESVLEVGCGSGQLARLLRDLGIRDYLGLDTNAMLVGRARTACPGYRFSVADIFVSSHLRAEAYDIAVLTRSLEFVHWDLVALELIRPQRTVLGAVSSGKEPGRLRQFTTADQVRERYGPVLRDLRVEPIHLPGGRTAFLFEGTK